MDMWCAEILLELQGKQYPGTHIITAIPFEGYDQEWKPEYKVRMALIRKHTENVVVCAEPSSDSYRKGTSIWWIMLTAFWLYMTSIIPFPAVEPQ